MRSIEWVSLLALGVMLLLAVWHDLKDRRIPNALVLWGVITATLLSMTPRGIGLVPALTGGLTGFLAFFFLYGLKMVGAGDVKLVAAVGLFLGGHDMASVTVSILLAGGVIALIWAIKSAQLVVVLKNIQTLIMRVVRTGEWLGRAQPLLYPLSPERVPYALAVGLGTSLHLAFFRQLN